MKKFDHNIGFWEKLSKIAENCDHNIDPRLGKFSPISCLKFFEITQVAQILT
jgi:hypothetical protein